MLAGNNMNNYKAYQNKEYREDFSSEDLISFNNNDEESFEKAYKLFFSPVYYFARRFTDEIDAAEDITAEAFYKLWKLESKKFTNVKQIKTYLQVCVRNASLSELRNKKVRKEHAKIIVSQQDFSIDTSVADITAELLRLVYKEIENLPPNQKKVFKLFYIEGLRDKEIAKQLKINEHTVRNHKVKARLSVRIACLRKYQLLLPLEILELLRHFHQ
ncbi:MAG TPA: sigma-70 family RNA polymerase sigma factor, partial [Puia sp.]|nr:sigma-70 family RNA polymerase sigma factor [Puia sp.]